MAAAVASRSFAEFTKRATTNAGRAGLAVAVAIEVNWAKNGTDQ